MPEIAPLGADKSKQGGKRRHGAFIGGEARDCPDWPSYTDLIHLNARKIVSGHDRELDFVRQHLRQILYVSRSTAAEGRADLDAIVERSRHNNALEGISGLLWSDGTRFLQVFEGPEESVAATFERIMDDPRHTAIEILSDRLIELREFGTWAMAHRTRWDSADAFDARVRRAVSHAAPEVRDAFLDLVAVDA